MQTIPKLRSPIEDHYLGHMPQTSRSGNLAYLSRSASTQPSSSGSKHGLHGLEKPVEETKGKKMTMLTRGASFRRQGSSGMTWADNWIFTDDGMFLGRHTKVVDEKGAGSGIRPTQESMKSSVDSSLYPELQRSHSVGSGKDKHNRSRNGVWGLKWIKKNFRKAFR